MNRALLRLAIALFIWGIGEGTFFYFQPLYLAELGADPFMIGKILGGVGIAMTIVHIPAGYLADKVGRLPLLRISWTFGLVSAVAMAAAKTLSLFTIGLILYSLTTFVVSPLNSYVTAARGKWTVERALTLISATFSAGMVSGPLIGGWLGDLFGLRSLSAAHVNSLIDDAQMGLAYGITETANALPFILAPPLAGYLYSTSPESPYPLSLLLIFVGIILTLIFFPRSRPSREKL